ncbi:MAG: hypothetical protein ACOX04_02925 [Candidatus Scatomorpha sp.]|jgi:hypothetical protein
MKKKTQRTVSIFVTLLMLLLLPVQAFAQEYDLANGTVSVTAKNNEQYVSQGSSIDEKQTSETVITGSSNPNTIAIEAEAGQIANVTLRDVDIDCSGIYGSAALITSGAGDVNIELDGANMLASGEECAGLNKNNAGSLTIGDIDNNGSLTATGGHSGAGIGGGKGGDGSNIEISGGTVTASGGIWAAGIGGGNNGDGNNITISGGTVTAIGGKNGAGIGGGVWGYGNDFTVSGDAQVRVQGGEADTGDGEGAGIGNGGDNDGEGNPIDGDEIEPDISNLTTAGWIKYYAPGTEDMDVFEPIRIINGEVEPEPEPKLYNAPAADSAYKIGDKVTVNGREWIIVGIDGDFVELASVDAFTEEQLKDLEALIKTLLTEAQLGKLAADKATGERVFPADENIANEYFGGEKGHIVIRANMNILDDFSDSYY